jgi:hypothetical protein
VNRRRWLLGILAAILAVVVTVVWVQPLVLGPEVACGLDPGPGLPNCNEMLEMFDARMQAEGRFEWLPVSLMSPGVSSDGCVSWYVERWIFAEVITNDC